MFDWAGAAVAGRSNRQEYDRRELLGNKSSKTTEIYMRVSNRNIGGDKESIGLDGKGFIS